MSRFIKTESVSQGRLVLAPELRQITKEKLYTEAMKEVAKTLSDGRAYFMRVRQTESDPEISFGGMVEFKCEVIAIVYYDSEIKPEEERAAIKPHYEKPEEA